MNFNRQLTSLSALVTHNRYEAYEATKKYEQSNREMKRLDQEFRNLHEHCQRLEHAKARTSAELVSATRAYGALATFKEKVAAQDRKVKSDLTSLNQLKSLGEKLEDKVRSVKRDQAEIKSSAELEDMTMLTHKGQTARFAPKDLKGGLSRGKIACPNKAALSHRNSFRLASLKQEVSDQAIVGHTTSTAIARGEDRELSLHSLSILDDCVSGEDLSLMDEVQFEIKDQELIEPEFAGENELSCCGNGEISPLSAEAGASSSDHIVTNDESSTGSEKGNDSLLVGGCGNSPSFDFGQEGLNSFESVQTDGSKFTAYTDLHDQNQRQERDTFEVHDSQSITIQVKNSKIKITQRQGQLTGRIIAGQDISDAKLKLLLGDL